MNSVRGVDDNGLVFGVCSCRLDELLQIKIYPRGHECGLSETLNATHPGTLARPPYLVASHEEQQRGQTGPGGGGVADVEHDVRGGEGEREEGDGQRGDAS